MILTFLQAWDLDFKLSASIGFQLAFCHLNSKNYTAAVDVCELVLARTPDYPRMKEEILKVALNHIRSG